MIRNERHLFAILRALPDDEYALIERLAVSLFGFLTEPSAAAALPPASPRPSVAFCQSGGTVDAPGVEPVCLTTGDAPVAAQGTRVVSVGRAGSSPASDTSERMGSRRSQPLGESSSGGNSLTARLLVEAGLAELRDSQPIVRAQDWPGISDLETP